MIDRCNTMLDSSGREERGIFPYVFVVGCGEKAKARRKRQVRKHCGAPLFQVVDV